jgi:hypothetical protein
VYEICVLYCDWAAGVEEMLRQRLAWHGVAWQTGWIGIVIKIQLINSDGRYFIIDCRSLLHIITENPTNVEHDE